MLDQRRAKENGYITLREAADLSCYSSDYIGQLIRNGKIRGEQVYSNVAWVTTEEEVRAYMEDKSRTVETSKDAAKIQSLSERVFMYTLYAVIALLVAAVLFMQYILYVSLDESIAKGRITTADTSEGQTL